MENTKDPRGTKAEKETDKSGQAGDISVIAVNTSIILFIQIILIYVFCN